MVLKRNGVSTVSKFKNKKTVIDNIVFDSRMEADFYLLLLDLKQKGIVADIELQPTYSLLPSFKKNGRTIRKMDYIADFLVTYENGSTEIIDVKGISTEAFKLKKKLFDYYYPDLTLKVLQRDRITRKWKQLK